ncbi:MAG: response regulator transcription factor [Bacilli bacterium]
MKTILVVDDEQEIRDLIEILLRNEGYTVLKAANGAEALKKIETSVVDLMVLDIMMPGMDGLEVCKHVRMERTFPILMVSAKSEDMDKIQGIMTGADDYMTKPFNPLELMVRVKALLRRVYYMTETKKEKDNLIHIGDFRIDKERFELKFGTEKIHLTSREFEIVYLLASNRGRVFSSEDIFRTVWKEDYFNSNNTIMVHMSRIREKLTAKGEQIIQTVWGVGYKIE